MIFCKSSGDLGVFTNIASNSPSSKYTSGPVIPLNPPTDFELATIPNIKSSSIT